MGWLVRGSRRRRWSANSMGAMVALEPSTNEDATDGAVAVLGASTGTAFGHEHGRPATAVRWGSGCAARPAGGVRVRLDSAKYSLAVANLASCLMDSSTADAFG